MNTLSEDGTSKLDQNKVNAFETNFDELKEKPSEGFVRRNRPGTSKIVSYLLLIFKQNNIKSACYLFSLF